MTIMEKLEHAMKYGYPVRVLYGHNEGERTGKVLSIGESDFMIDFSSGTHFAIKDVYKVEPVSDDSPDVEIAEIDVDERWPWSWCDRSGPQWTVNARDGTRGNVFLREVAKFAEGKDAKAVATLPDLVKQRDRLLETSGALVKWLTHNPIPPFNPYVNEGYLAMRGCIDEIEKNPLIRLTDNK